MSKSLNSVFADNGIKPFEAKGRKLAAHPTGPRAIDREAGTRTRPFKVLVASMSRTGTLSMYTALQKLNLAPYHMAEAVKDPSRDLNISIEALKASYMGEGKPFGKDEFDRWFGDYGSGADVPMCLLYKELLQAYPDAKVILATRDPSRWRASFENTVIPVMNWRIWPWLSLISSDGQAFHNHKKVITSIMDGWSVSAYNKHNDEVRKFVPKDRLLEYKLGEMTWKELCDFLGEDVPEGEDEMAFPKVNEGASGAFVAVHVVLINIFLAKAVKDLAIRVAPIGILAGAAWYARRLGYW